MENLVSWWFWRLEMSLVRVDSVLEFFSLLCCDTTRFIREWTRRDSEDELRRNRMDFGFEIASGCGEWGTSQVVGEDVLCLLERRSLTQQLIPPTRVVLPGLIQKSWCSSALSLSLSLSLSVGGRWQIWLNFVCGCGHKTFSTTFVFYPYIIGFRYSFWQ